MILLQNAVVMRDQFSDYFMWIDSIFARNNYNVFAVEIKTCLFDTKSSQKVLLRRMLFIIVDRFNVVQQNLKQTIIEWNSRTHQEVMKVCTTFIDLFLNRFVIMLQASFIANIHLFTALAFDVNFVLLSAAFVSASASASAFINVFIFLFFLLLSLMICLFFLLLCRTNSMLQMH